MVNLLCGFGASIFNTKSLAFDEIIFHSGASSCRVSMEKQTQINCYVCSKLVINSNVVFNALLLILRRKFLCQQRNFADNKLKLTTTRPRPMISWSLLPEPRNGSRPVNRTCSIIPTKCAQWMHWELIRFCRIIQDKPQAMENMSYLHPKYRIPCRRFAVKQLRVPCIGDNQLDLQMKRKNHARYWSTINYRVVRWGFQSHCRSILSQLNKFPCTHTE